MNTQLKDLQNLDLLHQRIAELEALVTAHQHTEQILKEECNFLLTLRQDYAELEQRMQERAAELEQANQLLQREINKRKQTEAEIVQRNGQLLTLQAAGAAISSSLDLQYILNTVTHEMTNLLGVEGCALSDWNQSKDTVQAIAGFSYTSWWSEVHLGHVFHLTDFPLTRRVLVEQHSQQLTLSQPDIDSAKLALMKADGIKTVLMLPMIFKKQVVGLIELIETQFERTFTNQEIALAQFLANQAAGAIENARLYQAQQDRRREYEALHRATLALISTFDLDEVFDRILTELQHVVPYDTASVQLLKGAHAEIIGGRGFPNLEEILGTKIPIYGQTPNTLVVETRQPVIIDEKELNDYPVFQEPPHVATSIRNWLGVPILVNTKVIGMLTLDKQQPGFYTEAHAQLASAYATQAAIAIENARLHQQAQQEIAERKRAEAAAIVSRDTLRRLIQQSPIGVQIFDIYGLCTDVNQAHLRIFGIKQREQVIGKFNLFEDRLAQRVGTAAAGRKALTGQVVHLPEVFFDFREADPRFTTTQGHRILSVTFFPIRDQADDIVQIVALNEDITERKRAEATLMLERERMSSTLKSIGDGVLALSVSGDIILTNPMAEAYLKILIDAENEGNLVNKEGQPLLTLLTFAPRTRVSYELIKSGVFRQVFEIVKQPLETEAYAGDQVIVIRDITEAQLAQERNQQQERLVAVGQLAAGIAHDFNNILTSVIGFAELLQLEPNLSPSALSDLQRIVQQGQRGAHLIRQILDFARQTIASKHPIDLAPLIRETVELLERTIPENIRMVVDMEPGYYLVNADPTQMQQVLTNLAVNAWDAMPTDGVLRFGLAYQVIQLGELPPHPGIRAGHWIVLSVSDTGTGMLPEVQSHIFEPFFTTKSVDKGTGLGLSQVDGIVKQHEGHIYVDSEVGKGTTFTLYLPSLTSDIIPSPYLPNGEVSRGQNQTILLVEDNINVLKVTQKMLQRLGYRILTATNGRSALEVYEQYQDEVALVLADSTMPIMGGVDLAQALHERNPAIKVVVITGYPLRDKAQELLAQGVINWLQKPLHFEQLAQAISEALETPGKE